MQFLICFMLAFYSTNIHTHTHTNSHRKAYGIFQCEILFFAISDQCFLCSVYVQHTFIPFLLLLFILPPFFPFNKRGKLFYFGWKLCCYVFVCFWLSGWFSMEKSRFAKMLIEETSSTYSFNRKQKDNV